MLQLSQQPEALAEKLYEALPGDLQHTALLLAQIFTAMLDNTLLPAEAAQRLGQSEVLRAALRSLSGHPIRADATLIKIDAGNQIGDISIGDLAGRDLIKLTVVLSAAAPPSVRQCARSTRPTARRCCGSTSRASAATPRSARPSPAMCMAMSR